MESVFARKTNEIISKTRVAGTKNGAEEQRKIMKQLMESNSVKK